MKPTLQRRLFKTIIFLGIFVCALSSSGGIGVIAALVLLGLWLFLDVQDSNRVSSVES